MPIPNRRQLHVPLLHCLNRLGKGKGLHVRDAVNPISDQFKLTRRERRQLSSNGQMTQIEYEIRWSMSGLKNFHGCAENVGRGTYRCTRLGMLVANDTKSACEDIRPALKRAQSQVGRKKAKPSESPGKPPASQPSASQGEKKKAERSKAPRRARATTGNLFEDHSATPESRFRQAVLNFLAGMEYWVQPVIDIRMPEGGDCFLFEMEHPHGRGRLCMGIVPQEEISRPLLTATFRLMKKHSIRQVHLVMRKNSDANLHVRRQPGQSDGHDIQVVGFSDLAKHLIDNDLVLDLS